MSKNRVTKKTAREISKRIISVGYCNLQHLLRYSEPWGYSTRAEGWACDYYDIPRGITISTGYSPIGKEISYDLCYQYDEAARKICEETCWDWQKQKARLNALLEDFAGDIERIYFTRKRKETT